MTSSDFSLSIFGFRLFGPQCIHFLYSLILITILCYHNRWHKGGEFHRRNHKLRCPSKWLPHTGCIRKDGTHSHCWKYMLIEAKKSVCEKITDVWLQGVTDVIVCNIVWFTPCALEVVLCSLFTKLNIAERWSCNQTIHVQDGYSLKRHQVRVYRPKCNILK